MTSPCTKDISVLPAETELSAGTATSVAEPNLVTNKVEPLAGGAQNLMPSAPSNAKPSPDAS